MSRLEKLATQFGVDPDKTMRALRRLAVPTSSPPPPAAPVPTKPTPDWHEYRTQLERSGEDTGSTLHPAAPETTTCKTCGSDRYKGQDCPNPDCTSGGSAHGIPNNVGRGKRSR